MSEPVYHFRLRGKAFGPGTLSQLTANPLLTLGNAMQIQVRQSDGADWIMIHEIVDFSRPWRARLPMGHRHVRLPKFQRTTWEQLVDMIYFRGSTESAENDALEIPDSSMYHYRCRWADTLEEFAITGYSHMMAYPPFPVEKAWQVELRRNDSRIWVPLPSLVNLSKGWPAPKPAPEPARRLAPQPGATPPSAGGPAESPGDSAPALLAGLLIVGIIVIIAALVMDTSVGSVHNLSKAHNQTIVLILGLGVAGVAALGLVIRAGRK